MARQSMTEKHEKILFRVSAIEPEWADPIVDAENCPCNNASKIGCPLLASCI